ncbi:serine protease of Rhomboid family [Clostridium sp. CAG:914]|jgi:rhomboid protease GluP|nr:rhomboid family intramembrane serine protease [Clostridium sp.]CDE95308.1 serine protease of Rhomboid family [Clostridium sp. CAG:914]
MENIKMTGKDVVVMNLVHYFITEKNYNPVVVRGVNDEIWLENMKSDYKLVRIVSHYIHNNEQLNYDYFRTKQISNKLKRKTFSFNMSVLNIYVDLGDNVNISNDDEHFMSVFINKMKDINNKYLLEIFPDIVEKTGHKEKGMELLFKITDDINKSNVKKNAKLDKLFSKKTPYITYIIMGICFIMFLITGMGNDTGVLIEYGANLDVLVKNGEYYRLLTSMFLHSGLLHLFFNMYALYIIGPQVESFFGKTKYLIIYLLSGISGSLLSVAFNVNTVSVGASGAIFGLFGALLYFGYNYRGYLGNVIKSQILPVVIINLIFGFISTGVDVAGHIGGLIGGIIVSSVLGSSDEKGIDINRIIICLIYFVFIIYLGLFR